MGQLSIHQQPPTIALSGNPIYVGVKESAALTENNRNLQVIVAISASVTQVATLTISFSGIQEVLDTTADQYSGNYLPLKTIGYSALNYCTDLYNALIKNKVLNDNFWIKKQTFISSGSIIFVAKSPDIETLTFESGISFFNATTLLTATRFNHDPNYLFGFQAAKIIPNTITANGKFYEVEEIQTAALEVYAEPFITERKPEIEYTDQSVRAIENVSSLLLTKKTGHFTFPAGTKKVVKHDILDRYKIFAYKKSGIPELYGASLFSNEFYVLNGKLNNYKQGEWNNLDKTFASFIAERKFLTFAPSIKYIDIYQPEKLYYIIDTHGIHRLNTKIYYADGTDETVVIDYVLQTNDNYTVYELSCAFNDIYQDTPNVVKYDIWMQNDTDTIISEVRTYILDYRFHPYARYFMYLNTLGVYECFRTTGEVKKTSGIEKTSIDKAQVPEAFTGYGTNPYYESESGNSSYNGLPTNLSRNEEDIDASESLEMTVNTGYINNDWSKYITEFLLSLDVYWLKLSKSYPVSIPKSTIDPEQDGVYANEHTFKLKCNSAIDELKDNFSIENNLPVQGSFSADFSESFNT